MTEDQAGHTRIIASEFNEAMLDMCDRFWKELAYNPTAFRVMLATHGGVEAARRLLNGPQAQSGLERLWQEGRLGESVEAHVLDPRYATLFTARERMIARKRLTDLNPDTPPE
jgi:hypothetical protein